MSVREAVVVFNGWGVGANWESLRALDDGRRRITFAPTVSDEAVWAQLRGVRRLVVVAWSMGVWRANAWLCAQAGALQDAGVAVVGSVAVNGTPFGIDDGLGIARRGFVQTARRLTPDGFALFVNRVRTPLQADLAVGEARLSVEAVEQLRAQLQALVAQAKAVSQLWNWQWAWVARGDRIVPYENQMRAWEKTQAQVRVCEGAHDIWGRWGSWQALLEACNDG